MSDNCVYALPLITKDKVSFRICTIHGQCACSDLTLGVDNYCGVYDKNVCPDKKKRIMKKELKCEIPGGPVTNKKKQNFLQSFFKRIFYKIKTIMCIIRYRNPKNSNLYKHAKHELDILLESLKLSNDPRDYKDQKKLHKSILKCVEVFCTYGHSGFSAQYAINNLIRLLHYKPIMPLTGCNHEWDEVTREILPLDEPNKGDVTSIKITYQNKRYSRLFKEVTINMYGEKIKEKFIDIDLTEEQCKDIMFPYIPGDIE